MERDKHLTPFFDGIITDAENDVSNRDILAIGRQTSAGGVNALRDLGTIISDPISRPRFWYAFVPEAIGRGLTRSLAETGTYLSRSPRMA